MSGENGGVRSGGDQGRHPYGGQDAAHVDLGPLPGHRRSRGRACRHALHLRIPPAEIVIGRHGRSDQVQVRPGAPGAQDRIGDLVNGSLIQALRVTGTRAEPRKPAQEDERLDPPRMRRREHQRRCAARPVAREHGPLTACLVQDRPDIVDLLIHGWRGTAGNRIRQSDAPVVVQDEPAERRQPANEPRQRGLHPIAVHVRVGPGLDHQQVRRPTAQHLVRQMDSAVARIAGLRRNTHTPIVMGRNLHDRRPVAAVAHRLIRQTAHRTGASSTSGASATSTNSSSSDTSVPAVRALSGHAGHVHAQPVEAYDPILRSSRPVMRDAGTQVDLHPDNTDRRLGARSPGLLHHPA